MDLTLKKTDKKIFNPTIVKHRRFWFGKYARACRIRLLKRRTNIYLLFQDCKDRLITCKSSGSSGIIGNKRRKKASQTVEIVFQHLYPYLKAYSIKVVHLIINTRISSHYYALLRSFQKFGLRIFKFTVCRRIAFNGCRLREKKRV